MILKVRSKVADFGVVITIASAVALDFFMGFDTPKLNVPIKFQTTIPSRGWFINPIERNKDKLWLTVVAIIPALLATILIFMGMLNSFFLFILGFRKKKLLLNVYLKKNI